MGNKGVVAAGHAATADAGRQVLEAGGNAIDAAIASAFAACAAEPLLTGLGAGGYMLVHDAKSGRQTLFDFAVVMPGKSRHSADNTPPQMTPVRIDFGTTFQIFHGGHASVGVPGFVAGLMATHKTYGTMPLEELVRPAQELAKEGVRVGSQQAYIIEILKSIIALTPACKSLFATGNAMLQEGDLFAMPDIADTLAEIARTHGRSFYTGDIARRLVQEIQTGHGLITAEDLAGYQAIERKPIRISYRGAEVITNPPPSSGGALIAHSLSLLAHFDLKAMQWHSAEHLSHLLETMLATNDVRDKLFNNHLHDEDILEKILAEEMILEGKNHIGNRLGNTTHISVIDAHGNAVSMTSSNGCGSGVAVPGTGILLNNILGEEDLNPGGFHKHPPGHRMTSMMSPTIVTQNGTVRLSVGSAGSNRIRSAVLQVISNVLDFDMDIADAIDAPRLHCEGQGTAVELEAGITPEVADALTRAGYQVSLWKEKNLFFGGAQGVLRNPETGELHGAGDPRRGGIAVIAK